MKLLRYGPAGQEKPGLLDRDGKIRDLSGAVRDIDGETLCRRRSTGCGGSTRDVAAGVGHAAARAVRRRGVEDRRDRAQLSRCTPQRPACRSRTSRSFS